VTDSVFDPNTFLDAETTAAFTRRPPIPAGVELLGIIGEPRVQKFSKKDGSGEFMKVFIPVTVDLTSYPEVHAHVQQNTVILTDNMFLDVTDDGRLDDTPGRNLRLGSYRKATGLNEEGTRFTLRMLQGRTVKVRIRQEQDQNGEMRDAIGSVGAP
jgi:hypothetical protein